MKFLIDRSGQSKETEYVPGFRDLAELMRWYPPDEYPYLWELKDWREEMKWVNAPPGWWKPTPMTKDIDHFAIVREMDLADRSTEYEEKAYLGRRLSLDYEYQNKDGETWTLCDVLPAGATISRHDTLQEKAWDLRREGLGSKRILEYLKENYPDGMWSDKKRKLPSRKTIDNLLKDWQEEDDPVELRAREMIKTKSLDLPCFNTMPAKVREWFKLRDIYNRAQSDEAKKRVYGRMYQQWKKINKIPKEVLIKYYEIYRQGR